MTQFQYLALAYFLVWTVLAVYIWMLGRRLKAAGRELRELQERTGAGEDLASVSDADED